MSKARSLTAFVAFLFVAPSFAMNPRDRECAISLAQDIAIVDLQEKLADTDGDTQTFEGRSFLTALHEVEVRAVSFDGNSRYTLEFIFFRKATAQSPALESRRLSIEADGKIPKFFRLHDIEHDRPQLTLRLQVPNSEDEE